MFRLLVLLCLSLYCAMSIYGNGPARTELYARTEPARPAAHDGVRVLPAPQPILLASTAAAKPVRPVPVLAPARTVVPDLTPAPAQPANVQLRWVAAGTANVRAEPNKRSALAGKIGRGGAVHVMWTETNGWVRVRSASGDVTGFVHKSLLTETAPPAETVTVATVN